LSAAALPRATAKDLSQAEEISENISQVSRIEALRTNSSTQTGVAETVVDGALFAVRQHSIGFAALFELILGVGIVGIAVGMELQGQFAIGALNFLLGGGAGNAQYFVVIAFSVAGQNDLPPNPFNVPLVDIL
jgi:hypothetical protein